MNKLNKGFTLIEIIIVLVIISIIGAISFPAFSYILEESHASNCKANRNKLTRKIESALVLQEYETANEAIYDVMLSRGASAIDSLQFKGICNNNIYTVTLLNDTTVKITCSKHGE